MLISDIINTVLFYVIRFAKHILNLKTLWNLLYINEWKIFERYLNQNYNWLKIKAINLYTNIYFIFYIVTHTKDLKDLKNVFFKKKIACTYPKKMSYEKYLSVLWIL